ncbi:hypothetical protein BCV72DRAFT_187064, partial [Rhizopus microsporus var. microsporus]
SKRQEDSVVSSMRKRQLEDASNITNAIVSNMEYIIKKKISYATSFSTNTNTVQTEDSYTLYSSKDEAQDVI